MEYQSTRERWTFPLLNLALIFFHIETASGDIEITGTDEKGAHATIEIYESEKNDVTASFENDTIKLTSAKGKKCMRGDAKVFIPKNISALKCSTASGDISLQNFKNSSSISNKAISGDIRIKNCEEISNIELKTVSGDILIKENSVDNLSFHTVSGDVRINDSKIDVLTGKTVSGDVDYKDSEVGKSDIKTVSGTITK